MSYEQAILDKDFEEIQDWLSLQSKEVQDNVTISDCVNMKQDYMLHIDKETPDVFIPMMPRSAGKTENNTVARITVSPNLIGCFIGYARVEEDFLDESDKIVKKQNDFKGGYVICTLPYLHSIKPSPQMVPDAERSNEHWLVTYNDQTREYAPEKVGKIFVSEVTYIARSGKIPQPVFKIFIEVEKPEGFYFSPTIHLKAGYHVAEVSFERESHPGSSSEESSFSITEIEKVEYDKVKRLRAVMLNHTENKPHYLKW